MQFPLLPRQRTNRRAHDPESFQGLDPCPCGWQRRCVVRLSGVLTEKCIRCRRILGVRTKDGRTVSVFQYLLEWVRPRESQKADH